MKPPSKRHSFGIACLALLICASVAFAKGDSDDVNAHGTPVRLTVYSTVYETDFGTVPSESIAWIAPDTGEVHTSLFVPGFGERDSTDPLNSNLSGAAMEGNGIIEASLHQNDPSLKYYLDLGYNNLNLEDWNEQTQVARLKLTKGPLNSIGTVLQDGVSSAVKMNDRLFPTGRWVDIQVEGQHWQYRKIDDECSSCEVDAHIDLYFDPRHPLEVPSGRTTAILMPEAFHP